VSESGITINRNMLIISSLLRGQAMGGHVLAPTVGVSSYQSNVRKWD
jgi:hypothetical protein